MGAPVCADEQPDCLPEIPGTFPEAHLFGLEPNFGCCTANFGQAWPKLALSAFLYREDTVLSAVPIPCELRTDRLSVALRTNYPFENEFLYTVQAREAFRLRVRIPSFARNLKVNGVPTDSTGEIDFTFEAGTDTQIRISYETAIELAERPHQLHCVKCGSLVFSIPIAYEKRMLVYVRDGVERKFPYCDYEYVGTSEWRYGYVGDRFEIRRHPVGEIPFASDNPPVTVQTEVQKIDWDYEDGFETVCAKKPVSAVPLGEKESIELYPYGCAKLRMTEVPLIPAGNLSRA